MQGQHLYLVMHFDIDDALDFDHKIEDHAVPPWHYFKGQPLETMTHAPLVKYNEQNEQISKSKMHVRTCVHIFTYFASLFFGYSV